MEPVNRMTIRTEMDAATLDAFVDGALSPEAAARVVLHLADCPGDQAYVDAVMETNALLAAAYGAPLHQALPERLRATIFPAQAATAPPRATTASPGARSASPRLRLRRAGWGLLAASAALAVGLAAGLAPSRGPGVSVAGFPGDDAELHAALETSPSGSVAEAPDGSQITLVASFLSGDGRPCREFEVLDTGDAALTQGVACRDEAGVWSSEIAVATLLAAPGDRGDGFVPAAGPGDDALSATLDRLGAGMSLTPDEERTLIVAGWTD